MKNDCLLKCLIEVGLEKFYSVFINNGITTCDLLTKVSLQSFPDFGIIEIEDKLKLFELIKIIKSIQADLIIEYENKNRVVKKDNEAIHSGNQQSSITSQSYLKSEISERTDESNGNNFMPLLDSNSGCSLNNKIVNKDVSYLGNDKDSSYQIESKVENITATKSTNQSMTGKNIIKTFNVKSSTKSHLVSVRSNKTNQSHKTNSKYPLATGRLTNKSNHKNPQPKLGMGNKKLELNFRPDEIQLSSTPLKPFNLRLTSNLIGSQLSSDLIGSENKSKRVGDGANTSKEMSELEVVSGHAPLFTRSSRRSLIPQINKSDATLDNDNGGREDEGRRRNTYDKSTMGQSIPAKYLKNKSSDHCPNKNIEQIDASRNNSKQLIIPADDVQAIASSITTDDIHLETNVYFKPIGSPPITISRQLTNDGHSSLEYTKSSNSIGHQNILKPENVLNLELENNTNINSNKLPLEADILSLASSSSVFTSNTNQPNFSLKANHDDPKTAQLLQPNKCSCVGCLETAHEQQLSDVTSLSSLEMQTLISYKQQRITEGEYVEQLGRLLTEKLHCVNSLLALCNQSRQQQIN